ncbi:MAG TPA: tripartite tricarboxylate transporter TctB family protein, partial [Burkholderiales bacterium]|nr:tripartite tricarboxylate transporter TctB family protein [Burkholderiales bacterium]
FLMTLGLKPSPLVPVGPGFYPRIVLAATALFALALVAGDLAGARKPAPLPAVNYGAVVLHFALFGLYVAALPALGFRIATFLYVAVANGVMAPPRQARDWLRMALLALGTAAATYYVFEHYLAVLLPRGRWTDF